ncbi:MAG: hypothetical protein M3355_01530 [Actinomycetota bacterium]|nr:hypothetical protein [Actinomycetota bacterium]
MRADYDSEGDTIEIELEVVDQLDRGVDLGGAVVHLADGRPVVIDVLSASKGVEDPLTEVASRFDLDAEVLIAAARSALAVPDRQVTLKVAAPRVAI